MNSSAREQKYQSASYLRLHLTATTQGVIPTNQLQEVVIIESDRLTPIPNMPHWIMGLLNQRSRIFWVIDLPHFLGLAPIHSEGDNYNLAIVRIEEKAVGLRLDTVEGIIRFAPENIQSPVGVVPSALEPYLSGCILYAEEILLVLEAAAIVQGATNQLF